MRDYSSNLKKESSNNQHKQSNQHKEKIKINSSMMGLVTWLDNQDETKSALIMGEILLSPHTHKVNFWI